MLTVLRGERARQPPLATGLTPFQLCKVRKDESSEPQLPRTSILTLISPPESLTAEEPLLGERL